MKTTHKTTTARLCVQAFLIALLLLMSYTPLGYLNVGPLAITFNVIPVALASVALGPVGGAITGAFFGLTSFLQCIGVGGNSAMGAILFQINPFFAFVQRFVPRLLEGLLCGYLYRGVRRLWSPYIACAITGFGCAFLNTSLFMGSLVLLFGNSDYMQGLIDGRNILVFICTFVGVNALAEMFSSTVITGAVGSALIKAKLLPPETVSHRKGGGAMQSASI